ncbi:MAG: efflux RND transporter permease subunit [Candidatus Omnitrophica bacterium]|jgi:HAE1 family hydrophobic/amphiphilic exporter-1|nr:efflux RND transporter permease subunit [Candidatus Omnitrophota bacterium]MDD5079454.1 efflux RND transporter permease subunit [Candidatus Omnitrophota bacterium]
MNLAEFGVKRPVTNLMIFLALIIISLYAMSRLGVDMMPTIETPAISVITSYSGASPEDVETKVTEPLENQLAITPGLDKITSTSSEGISVVTLQFKWGINIDEASNDVRDRIDQAKPNLPDIPDEISTPFLWKFNTANMPIMVYGFKAERSYAELYDMIDRRICDPLKQLAGVGTVQLNGGLERQINIWLDRQKLEGYGFSPLDIEDALDRENVTLPVGNLKSGLTDYLLRLPGEFASPDEIKSVILGIRKGKVIYLRDVARIEDAFKEVNTIVRIDRKRGLTMMVQKQTGTNTVEVAERVQKRFKELMKTLPVDVKAEVVFDTSEEITLSLKSLSDSLWLAIVLVVLVVWFFLRQFTPSFIIALTIPFSLLITFLYLFLSGRTINVISLSSMAIASGMVVDNAIVVVDNIFRKLERGQRVTEAAVFGTSEMFLSIAAATLTTIVVFLPMFFITGVVGVMFSELAAIVTATLLASLFTASTFSPMLCSKWLKPAGQKKPAAFSGIYNIIEKIFVGWENVYSKTLGWSLNHKKSVIISFAVVFFFSLMLTRFVGNEFIPQEDTGDLQVMAKLPVGTRMEESDKVAKKVEDIFDTIKEKKFSYVRSGQVQGIGRVTGQSSGSHVVYAGLKLVPKDQRKRSDKAVGQDIRSRVRKIPGVEKVDISTGSMVNRLILGGGGKSIQIEIIGNSFEDTNMLAGKIKKIVEGVPGAVDVVISRDSTKPEIRIAVDRERAASLGLDMNSVAQSIKTFVEGSSATKYREKGRTYDIYVRLEESSRSQVEDVENLALVSSMTGKQVKLSSFASIYETAGPVQIERKNRERVVRVEANTLNRSSGKIVEDIKREMDKLTLPADIIINFGGEAEEQRKAFGDLIILLSLGIVLVYMVIAAQFESLLDPFIIMFSIPFTFTGVIWAMAISRMTLNVLSFLGMVMLMGIVVNNAIVLISYINILRARGNSMYEAVTAGGKDRLRPVLMTTITTLVGLLPLALSTGQGSETWQPIGITMVGGLTVSTFITMLFVPILYAVFHHKQTKQQVKVRKCDLQAGGE